MKTNTINISFSKRKMIAAALIFSIGYNSVKVFAATAEKVIKSKIESVTVFTSGAQISRAATVSVNPGNTTLVFESLEPSIDVRSIQASGNGNFIIMDVQHVIKYPEIRTSTAVIAPKNAKHILLLQDSIVELDFDLEEIATKREALNIEKTTLLNNRMIKGETKKDTLNLLKEAMFYLREKLNNINSELMKLKKQEYALQAKRVRLENDLSLLQNYNVNTNDIPKDETKYQIVVTVSSETMASGNVVINYMLKNAGWSPSYDIRAKGATGHIQLTYKAHVFQNTGTDWNDVKLTLSTANPNQSNVRPVLNTWWLTYYNQYPNRYSSSGANAPAMSEVSANSVYSKKQLDVVAYDDEYSAKPVLQTVADYTLSEENIVNMEYEIKIPYSIPSDGKTHFVAVQNKEIDAQYIHFAAPKFDKDAFLVARITNWDELNLVPGNANIYFDGTFVGETHINSSNSTDTLDITLGRDKNMVITRVKQKDKTKEKIVGEQKMKTVTYEITVRNTKSTTSVFNLQDQIPVSQNKEIVIALIEASGGAVNTDTGILDWKMNIKPKETKKITLTYSITYPKDKVLAGI
ncbi:MAG: DUF4139 domain-containing protein [Bacteroidia bacterium]